VLASHEAAFVADESDLRYESAGGVAVGVSGDLFVAEPGFIERLRPRPPIDAALTADEIGSDVNPLLGDPVPFDGAADIALGPNGTLYVADARRNRVCRIERATGEAVTIVGTGQAGFSGDAGLATGAMLRGPGAIALAHNGDLYIADTLNNRIRVVSRSTGRIRTIAGDGAPAATGSVGDNQPASRGHLNRPSGVAVAANGDVYIADTGHNRVRKVNGITGIITTVAGDGEEGALGDGEPATSASLAAPMGLALVPSKGGLTIYVADSLNDRVRVIDVEGRIWTLAGPEPIVTPVRIAYHPAGWLYVKDGSPDGVTAVAASTALNAAATATPRVSRRDM
jgi:DNA-binding beta-propeller fold protein YncE